MCICIYLYMYFHLCLHISVYMYIIYIYITSQEPRCGGSPCTGQGYVYTPNLDRHMRMHIIHTYLNINIYLLYRCVYVYLYIFIYVFSHIFPHTRICILFIYVSPVRSLLVRGHPVLDRVLLVRERLVRVAASLRGAVRCWSGTSLWGVTLFFSVYIICTYLDIYDIYIVYGYLKVDLYVCIHVFYILFWFCVDK